MNSDRVYYSNEAETQAKRDRTGLTMFVLTLGLGIGAGLALLFAPSSGKQARTNLAQSLEEDWENGRDAVNPMVKRFKGKFAELRKKVEKRVAELT